jgi:hypothetical protein
MEIENLKDNIFNGQHFKFEKNKEKIQGSILGTIKVLNTTIIDSVILTNLDQFKDLMTLCEFPIDQKWTLIYRATQDGFEASSFHDKCDDKPNTLVVIKSTNGNVFGGYTEQSWTGSGFKTDPNAFIFSLINEDSEPLKIKCVRPDEAIYCSTEYGPNFGLLDIKISSESNKNSQSCSNIGYPDYEYDSNEAQLFLAGSDEFQVLEIEIYTRE